MKQLSLLIDTTTPVAEKLTSLIDAGVHAPILLTILFMVLTFFILIMIAGLKN